VAIHRWLNVQRRRQAAQLSASPTHTLRVQTGERLAEPIGVCRALNATSGNLTELVIAPCDADTQSGIIVARPKNLHVVLLRPLKPMTQWHNLAQTRPSTSKIPFGSSARAIGRAKLCHHLTQWLCHKGWSAAVAYLLAKVLLILVTTLSH
jgi:hypothetical protein